MERNININFKSNETNIKNNYLKKKIMELSTLYLNEIYKGNKVAFYYEDINSSTQISFNQDICFYAASSIKILVCLILFEQAENNKIDLTRKILISMNDLKRGTGIIKNQIQDKEYNLLELIRLCLVESDNTAYLKLVDIIGKKQIAEYGYSLGAKHTMEGKETDSFGIINCHDMIIYWKKIISFIDKSKRYGTIFQEYLSNPTIKLINSNLLDNKNFFRKYGAYDIAYHEAGYVLDENPYYIIILTQLNKVNYKEKFMNETITKISEIHKIINNRENLK